MEAEESKAPSFIVIDKESGARLTIEELQEKIAQEWKIIAKQVQVLGNDKRASYWARSIAGARLQGYLMNERGGLLVRLEHSVPVEVPSDQYEAEWIHAPAGCGATWRNDSPGQQVEFHPHDDGFDDFKGGQTLTDNPHAPNTWQWAEWQQGWLDARDCDSCQQV